MYRYEELRLIQKEFDINTLSRRAKHAMEDIQTIQRYITECTARAQLLPQMEIRKHILVIREKGNWVFYYVSIREMYYLDGKYQNHYRTKENKEFGGNERLEAIAYAKELKQKFYLPVIKEGNFENIKFDV